jgi:hypothetical protein
MLNCLSSVSLWMRQFIISPTHLPRSPGDIDSNKPRETSGHKNKSGNTGAHRRDQPTDQAHTATSGVCTGFHPVCKDWLRSTGSCGGSSCGRPMRWSRPDQARRCIRQRAAPRPSAQSPSRVRPHQITCGGPAGYGSGRWMTAAGCDLDHSAFTELSPQNRMRAARLEGPH